MKQILHHSNNLLIALSVGLLFSLQSCGEKSVYNEYNKIATVGWDFGTPVRFETEINDTLSAYDITIQVRNNTDYAYQNFWIFVESTSPSGIVAKDTLEFLFKYLKILSCTSLNSQSLAPILFLFTKE